MDMDLDVPVRSRTNVEMIPKTLNESELQLTPSPSSNTTDKDGNKLLYEVDDVPPWYLTIFLAFQWTCWSIMLAVGLAEWSLRFGSLLVRSVAYIMYAYHYLTMLGATVVTPYLIAPALCIGPEDPARAHIISTIIFVSGIVTFLQATIGVRLPVIQGSTISYIIPTLAILNLPKWQCPEGIHNSTLSGTASGNGTLRHWTQTEKDALWHERICEVQGCIFVASFLEIFIGITGLTGLLLRYITPLSMMPVMTLVGLALFEHAAEMASKNWAISTLTVILMVFFAEYLGEKKIPCGSYSPEQGCHTIRLPIFKLFPVLFSVSLVWIVCVLLTHFNVLPASNHARTDLNTKLIEAAPWFRVPYPGQWGMPTVSLAGVCGMFGAVLATVFESVGNYYACARLCQVSSPPVHAMNRGVFVEGIGSMMSGLWGTSDGTTSYAENIGVIGVTKVASRRVIQVTAVIMIFFGMMSKFGALFVAMPDPIVGGIFFVMFSLIASVGLANLQYVNFSAPRTLIVAGLPLFCGLAIPKWLDDNKDAINTGVPELDNVLVVILSTSMFVGGFLGFLLDNTIPGTPEERGLTKWAAQTSQQEGDEQNGCQCYNFPFGMDFLKNCRLAQYIPISPFFKPELFSCKTQNNVTDLTPCNGIVTQTYSSDGISNEAFN